MLNENQVHEFKKILDRRYFELCEEVRLELISTEDQYYIDLAGQVHDSGEASVADLLVDLNLAEIDRHIRDIRAVEEALMRIKAGTYDICDDCKATISTERLQASPAATRCHRCQVNHEHTYAGDKRPSM
ncbi:MAG: TraR/DksA C4-type zinc finger protein [Lysobacterales bacterium]